MNALESAVTAWPGIEMEPHRFGGREFTLAGREIGHHHDGRLIDIPFPMRVRDILLEEDRVQTHHVYPDSGWVSYRIRSDDDLDGARWALRVSYLYHLLAARNRRNAPPETKAVDVDAALAELNVSDELHRVFRELRAGDAEPTAARDS